MSEKPELIKVDMGPYASRLYKYDLFHNEEYRLDTSKGLKFLHFNAASQGVDINKVRSKRMFKVWQNRTVAALALSPHGVRKVAAEFLALAPDTEYTIPMCVGVSFVSKDDNYSKEIGRDESVKKMAEIDMKVIGLQINSTHIYVNLAPLKGIALTLRLNKKTGFSTVTGSITGRAEDL
jgi:hypothetical protein